MKRLKKILGKLLCKIGLHQWGKISEKLINSSTSVVYPGDNYNRQVEEVTYNTYEITRVCQRCSIKSSFRVARK